MMACDGRVTDNASTIISESVTKAIHFRNVPEIGELGILRTVPFVGNTFGVFEDFGDFR